MRLDFMNESKLDEYPKAFLVEFLRSLDVRYGSVEVEMHDENIFDL